MLGDKTQKKYIIIITRGETIFPNNIPNLNQSLFAGDKIAEFNKPKIRNIKETNKDQYLTFSLFIRG